MPVRDITKHKQTEEELKASEELYRALVETTGTGYVIIDTDGKVLDANPEYVRLTGHRTRKEIIGKNVLEWTAGYEKEKNAEAVKKCAREGYIRNLEIDYVDLAGKVISVEINATVVQIQGTAKILTLCRDITDRKRAEEAFRMSEHKYRILVENIPEKIFVKDASLTYVSCNEQYARDLGIISDAIGGKTDFDFYPRDLAEKYRADDRAVMDSGEIKTIEERYVADGKEFWVSTIKTPIREVAGNVSGILGIFHDITDRKRMEQALKESESFNRGLVENLPEYIVVYGPDGKILYVNPAAARVLGYDADKLVGTSVLSYVAEEHRDEVISRMEIRHEGREVPAYETDIVTQDGHRRSVIAKGTPIQYHDSPAFLILLIDITERIRAEEVIRESEERYRTLAEASPDQIFIVGRDDTMKYVNPASLKLFRLPYDQVIGTSRKNLFPPEIADAQGILLKKIFETGEPVKTEEKIQFGTQELWIDTSSVPLKDETGNVTAVLGIARDITERKKAEVLLKRFNEELEQQVKSRTNELNISLKEKEVLLKEIHHRVRNNLQVVSSIISLQAKSVSDPASLQQIQEIRMRIGTLALVHEIAYLAKTPESINMRDFLYRCTSRVIDEFGCEPGRIDITITAENVQVALNQAVPCSLIVNELLMNSIRHAFPGKRHGEIRIGFSIAKGNYVLEYSDDGVGFPEGMHLEGAETGGLSLIQGLARQIRGKVESTTRPGTRYTLTFPAETSEDVKVW